MMVKVRYLGLRDPEAAFRDLRPFRQELIRMSMRFAPFKDDWMAVYGVVEALDAAADRFIGEDRRRAIYSVSDTGAVGRAKPSGEG